MKRLNIWLLVVAAVVCGLFASQAGAQGFIVPRHPRPPRPHPPMPPRPIFSDFVVHYQHVDIKVDDQVARVQVSQAFSNTSGRTMEVEYFFPLPENAAIDNLVLMVDGKEIPGRLMGRDEARRIYEDIVRRRKDPALLEYMGRGLFKTSVFPLPPGQQRQVNLSYTQLCKRDGNAITINYPLGTGKHAAKPLHELKINCRITNKQPIKSIYSPTHDVNITRPSETVAEVSLVQHNVVPRNDFALVYGVADGDVGLTMLSYRPTTAEAGYFMLLASPRIETAETAILPKSVVLVLDKSGSMTGKKIEQAKNSLRFVLKNLNANDTFNIVTYDSDITSFKPELQRHDEATLKEALSFVDQIAAGGSTNIDGALRTAMGMLKANDRPSYVIFLTDGLPTAGEQREQAIVSNCKNANNVRARLMAFGVGNDVNARLIDKLTAANHGDSNYVRPNQDIEGPVSRLYSKLSSPVMSDLRLAFPGLDTARTYPSELPDLFKGSQLVVVGRYHNAGDLEVKLSGHIGSKTQALIQRVTLDTGKAPYERSFIEKLWAERRVGYLIDEIDLHGQNKELVDEIVRLSTRHGILTPYTSFLADERTDLYASVQNNLKASANLQFMETETSGAAGVGQRVAKMKRKARRRAPVVGAQVAVDLEGREQVVQTVQNLGLKTFYQKNGRWIDSTVTKDQEKQVIKLVQYSDAYFDVIRKLPAKDNQYFTLDGEMILNIGGQTYLVVPEEMENGE